MTSSFRMETRTIWSTRVNELIGAANEVMTLFPGDVIAAGSPVRSEQIFLKPGDKIRATIDGIGTLNHTVKADRGE